MLGGTVWINMEQMAHRLRRQISERLNERLRKLHAERLKFSFPGLYLIIRAVMANGDATELSGGELSENARAQRAAKDASGEAIGEPVGEDASSLPTVGRLAGIDYGTVRVGLATCDPSQRWVTPLETYNRRNDRLDAAYFAELAKREAICGWVLGLPIHCDGKESQKSVEVRRFAEWLESVSDLPFALFDERFTTAEARHMLRDSELSSAKKKKQLDRLAAHLILSGFVESRRISVSQNEALED